MKRPAGMETFYARAWDINNTGVVVGDFRRSGTRAHAFRWKAGALKDLGTLGGPTSNALAVNNAGTILGWAQIASGGTRTFLYRQGTMTDIGSFALGDLGPADEVTGTVTRSAKPFAIVWHEGVVTELGPGYGGPINQNGWVAVRRNTASGTIVELYKPN